MWVTKVCSILSDDHLLHAALTLELNAVVVDAGREVVALEGEGVESCTVEVEGGVDRPAEGIGDAESDHAGLGQVELELSTRTTWVSLSTRSLSLMSILPLPV